MFRTLLAALALAAPAQASELPPRVVTGAASPASTSATLIAVVRSAHATAHFDYGTTTAYGASRAAVVNSGTATATLDGLQPDTTYHYRVVAANAHGTAAGVDRSFTTTAPAPPVDPATGGAIAPAPGQADVSAPAVTRLVVRRGTLAFTLSELGCVEISLTHRKHEKTRTLDGKAGRQRVKLGSHLRPGRYRVAVTATDSAGNRSDPARLTFSIGAR